MAELFISPIARADMKEIGDYISHELCNTEAALGMIRKWLFRELNATVEQTARLLLTFMPPPLRQLYSVDPKELLFPNDAP